jgi:hypothetical protein
MVRNSNKVVDLHCFVLCYHSLLTDLVGGYQWFSIVLLFFFFLSAPTLLGNATSIGYKVVKDIQRRLSGTNFAIARLKVTHSK